MIVLTVTGLSKSFGTEKVLEDVNLTLAQGERMGLVGVNGSGKTTLLRILSGRLDDDEGSIALQKGMIVGYLEQRYEPAPGSTVLDEMMSVFAPLLRVEERLREIEREMALAGPEELIRLGHEYSKLQERFEREEGYAVRSRVQGVLRGLGFSGERQLQEARLLSGGELTRLSLGRLLLQKPDLLLLDEPTNHLDLEALEWLEGYLKEYAGAVLVVSHDRYFLDSVCTSMTEILFGVSEQYKGNYTRYMEQREERFLTRMRAWEQQQKEIARQQAIIARYRSFNREKSIRAAESREKALERMELVDRPVEERQIRFSFTSGARVGEEALLLDGLSKSFGERRLFQDVSALIRSGERVALIGPNGVGKSTLLEILMGHQQADSGRWRFGSNADVGYYDQKQQSLHDEKTVLREVWDDFPRLLQHEVRGALGQFLFTGEEVFKPVGALSGGEKARVALTKLMLRRKSILILDEPTNHLDSDSREALEAALEGFEGTILAVSHDRYFINRFATRVLVMTESGLESFEGNYDAYLAELARLSSGESEAEAGLTRTEIIKRRRQLREKQEQGEALRRAVSEAEEEVSREEEELKRLEAAAALPEVYANPEAARENAQAVRLVRQRLEEGYARWEHAEEALFLWEEDRGQP